MNNLAGELTRFPLITQTVCLGTGEWDDGTMMVAVAKEALAQMDVSHPGITGVVTVNEHGGWFLQYVKHPDEPGELMVIGTANDTATWRPRQEEMRKFVATCKWEYLDTLHRLSACEATT